MPRAFDSSGLMAPPSTTIPSGAPRAASHGGKRSSNGAISQLPSGDSPARASSDEGRGGEPPAGARASASTSARGRASPTHSNEIGRRGEEAENLGERKEHRALTPALDRIPAAGVAGGRQAGSDARGGHRDGAARSRTGSTGRPSRPCRSPGRPGSRASRRRATGTRSSRPPGRPALEATTAASSRRRASGV